MIPHRYVARFLLVLLLYLHYTAKRPTFLGMFRSTEANVQPHCSQCKVGKKLILQEAVRERCKTFLPDPHWAIVWECGQLTDWWRWSLAFSCLPALSPPTAGCLVLWYLCSLSSSGEAKLALALTWVVLEGWLEQECDYSAQLTGTFPRKLVF